MPDISLLKEVSKVLDISVDDLLNGKIKLRHSKEINKTKIIFICILITLLIFLIFLYFFKDNGLSTNTDTKKYKCTATYTYYINNISASNDENYLYVTITQFQNEGVYTIKLSKTISEKLEIDKNYEFTFNSNPEYKSVDINILFENSEIINVEHTDKVGLEQINKFNC